MHAFPPVFVLTCSIHENVCDRKIVEVKCYDGRLVSMKLCMTQQFYYAMATLALFRFNTLPTTTTPTFLAAFIFFCSYREYARPYLSNTKCPRENYDEANLD